MSGAVQMQDHVIPARPVRHGLNGGVADDQVDHDNDRAQLLGKLGSLVHVLHGAGGDVQIVTLDFTGGGLGTVDRFHAVEKAVAPVHERLRVDVFIILVEIQAATGEIK